MRKSSVGLTTSPLVSVLKAKSRRRRETLAELSRSSISPHLPRNDLLPKLELVELEIAKLTLPQRNVRMTEHAHVMQVANSISTLGFCDPIFVDEQGAVLDGRVRVEGAKLLGLTRIPCIRANHLSALPNVD
jgi:hypothetical protein